MNRRSFSYIMAGTLLAGKSLLAAPQAKGIRFSYMLWALGKETTFDRAIEIVAEAGYQGVELTGQFQKWSPEEMQRIKTRMTTLKLVVDSTSGAHAPFAIPESSEQFLKDFAQLIHYAKQLECPQVILTSGKRQDSLGPQVMRSTSVDNIKRAAELAAKEQIEIVIEPIDFLENPAVYMASVNDGFEIAQAVNAPNVRVLYDFYHEQRSFGNLIEKLEKNIDRVGLIHIADVPGRHEPGTGEVDYTNIYRKLAALKYDRWIAMEFYPTIEPVASLKKARVEAQQALGIS